MSAPVLQNGARKLFDFRNKVFLAPMVRVGRLPFRILSRFYGADATYTEEQVDYRLVRATRSENPLLGTVDFHIPSTKVKRTGDEPPTVIYRTTPDEKENTIFQLGSANATTALEAAKLVEDDVAAVDLNCGCPEAFSIKAGMGAALLQKPDLIVDILTTLKANLSVPVSCKIRLLPTLEETIELVKKIEATGVDAIGVHMRFVPQRSRVPAHWDWLKAIVDSVDVPIIANGDALNFGDIEKLKELTGCSSVMIARGAMWNPSIFSPAGFVSQKALQKQFFRYSYQYQMPLKNLKFCIMGLSGSPFKNKKATLGMKETRAPHVFPVDENFRENSTALSMSKGIEDFAELTDSLDWYKEMAAEREQKCVELGVRNEDVFLYHENTVQNAEKAAKRKAHKAKMAADLAASKLRKAASVKRYEEVNAMRKERLAVAEAFKAGDEPSSKRSTI